LSQSGRSGGSGQAALLVQVHEQDELPRFQVRAESRFDAARGHE
jgi:hypothetical protein